MISSLKHFSIFFVKGENVPPDAFPRELNPFLKPGNLLKVAYHSVHYSLLLHTLSNT